VNRSEVLASIGGAGATLALGQGRMQASAPGEPVKIVCVIRYQIDPFQRDEFEYHAKQLIGIIPRCGGYLIGYFLPYEGTNDIAWGLIGFGSLAAYETYRARLKRDPEAIADRNRTESKRVILREERNFVAVVDGTFGLPPAAQPLS
jgi:hypothetical protein